MDHPYSKQEEQNVHNKQIQQSENAIGLDQEEQAMNGLYGMPETDSEDTTHENM